MLEDLRKKQKSVIYVVAFVFIVGMGVMGVSSLDFFKQNNVVGKVNGKKISYPEYQKLLQQAIQNYMQANPDVEVNEETIQQLNDQTWDRFVMRTLLDKQLKKYHISVNDKDILDKMRNNPPDDVKTSPYFQTNGRFDYQKYITALTSNEQFAAAIEANVRETMPYEKLVKAIKAQVKIAPDSVRREYMNNNTTADAQIIFFDNQKAGDFAVSDAEIKAYYEKNKEKEFKRKPSSKIRFISLTLDPSAEDFSYAKRDIDDVYNRILEGEDFAKLATEFSQDPGSKQNGGDLGFFGRNQMVPEFDKMAFSMQPGQISKPFKTSFGWHILKVVATRTNEKGEPEVQASHILIKVRASQTTKDALLAKAQEIRKLARKKGIEFAAKQYKMQATETEEIEKDAKYLPYLGKNDVMLEFAKKKRVKSVSDVIPADRNGGLLIAQVTDKQGEHYAVMNDLLKSQIKFSVLREKQNAAMAQKAKQFMSMYQPAQYLEMAKKEGLQVIDAPGVKKWSGLPTLGTQPELVNAILTTKTNQFTPLIKGKEGMFLAFVTNHTYADMKAFESQKDGLLRNMRNREEEAFVNKWYTDLRDNAKIIDNRAKFSF